MSSKSKPKQSITEEVLVFLTKQLAINMHRKDKQEKQQRKKEEKAKTN